MQSYPYFRKLGQCQSTVFQFKLVPYQFIVFATPVNELAMRSLLGNPSVLKINNLVGIHHGAQPVRHHYHGTSAEELPQCLEPCHSR